MREFQFIKQMEKMGTQNSVLPYSDLTKDNLYRQNSVNSSVA